MITHRPRKCKVMRADKLPNDYKRLTLECGHTVCQVIHKKIPKTMICYECPALPGEKVGIAGKSGGPLR